MRDIVLLAVVAGFFALAGAYVRACASVVGPEIPVAREDADPAQAGETVPR